MAQNKILGKVAFATQYAKLKADGTRESYIDAMDRVKAMHVEKFPALEQRIEQVFKDFVYPQIVFPSQRSTQFGGDAIKRNNMRLYNCTASYCDRVRFFAEGFWLLMSGCGVGFSIQRHHVLRLPKLITKAQRDERMFKIHVVQDSIEGWADAVFDLIKSYLPSDDTEGRYEINFHYDQVRPEGAPISIGGVAPGPQVLKTAIEKVKSILDQAVNEGISQLRPIHCFDMFMHISHAALLSSRRAATIALFSPDDDEMMSAKTGDWWRDNPQRAYANISAQIITSDITEKKDVFDKIVDTARQYGEPGFFFAGSTEYATNPCGEIGLYPQIQEEDGSWSSGWAVCNLNEIVVSNLSSATSKAMYDRAIDDDEDADLKQKRFNFLGACQAAAFLGTLQASYTQTGYLGDVSKRIIERDALIGVSMTGIMHDPKVVEHKNFLQLAASLIRQENELTAQKIGINRALRCTTIKPSGNSSTVAGCCAGIHPYHARHYIRRMRINKINPIWNEILSKLPQVCDDSDSQVGIVAFACEAPEGAILRSDIDAVSFLNKVKFFQDYWVMGGNNPIDSQKGLTHNVSNTCTVKDTEWDAVKDTIWELRKSVRGISLLSDYGDTVYKNAPYEAVDPDNEFYKTLLDANWDRVDFSLGGYVENPQAEPACAGGVCLI